ncbi:putative D,D-dipeptide transport system permease protein DdpB [bioreactor metagenome]|uniref:Putative D,D-dipeptide transport system permease protein DdpB n=1 Tax=bioreactor metagenome TaxID=1076179 RepID=A0A645IGC9_9ZZZZ
MLIFGYIIPVLPILGRIDASIMSPPTVTGFMTIDSLLDSNMEAFKNSFLHLIMPSIALAMSGMAQAARITRASMIDNLSKDFVGAEISSGIPMKKVLMKYVMKPSLISTVSIIALDIAAMIGNAFLVELVFNYPGISRYGINAMLNKDLNAITAVIMIIGIAFLVVNIIVDIIAAYLDPRIRLQGGVK